MTLPLLAAASETTLRFEISPCAVGNDHEARPIIGGEDWLRRDSLGLDPTDLFPQLRAGGVGRLIVGRCACGSIGCDDVFVEAQVEGDRVRWTIQDGRTALFDRAQYEAVLTHVVDDVSWETIGRTVERRLGEIFDGALTEEGYTFDWASTRITQNVVHLSVVRDGEQRLLEFNWDGESVESALWRGRQFYKERFIEAATP